MSEREYLRALIRKSLPRQLKKESGEQFRRWSRNMLKKKR